MLCCILQFSLISQHLFILLHIQSDAWPMVLCALAKVATFILFFAIFTKYLYKSRSDCARATVSSSTHCRHLKQHYRTFTCILWRILYLLR